jgi:hypothetical protein
MSCNDLGFDDYGNLRVSKSADIEETLPFPSPYDFTGYTGELQIRATEDGASAALTVTETATAAGSVMSFDGANIVLLVKAADSATLPDADDPSEPWVGVYEWVLTDTAGLTTRLVSGSLIAEKGVVR